MNDHDGMVDAATSARRTVGRRAGATVALALVVLMVAGCYPTVKSGQRCRVGDPRGSDGTYVLDCISGRYRRVMTLAEAERRAALLAPARIQAESGAGQVVTVGAQYAPIVLRVVNGNGAASANALVEISGPAGGASLSSVSARTGGDGRVVLTPTAGTTAGLFAATARVSGTGVTTSFFLGSKAGAAAAVSIESGAGQSASVTTQFAAPVVGRVVDAYGNGVAGQAVTFSAQNDRVWFGPATRVSDGNGLLSTTSGAGQIAGTETGIATLLSNGATTAFPMVIAAGTPVSVQRNSGNAQGTYPGNRFFFGLTIGVLDSFGNGVPGVPVTYTAVPGGSGASITVPSTVVETNADGIATMTAFANLTSGVHQVVATVAGQTVTFGLENFPPA